MKELKDRYDILLKDSIEIFNKIVSNMSKNSIYRFRKPIQHENC